MNVSSIMTTVGFTGLLVALLAMVTVNQAFVSIRKDVFCEFIEW